MQRARNVLRKKEETPREGARAPKHAHLLLSSDLIFLISHHDLRIADLIGIDPAPANKSMAIREILPRESFLEYDSPVTFDFNLKFYRAMRHLQIVSSKKVYLSSLSRMHLDGLTLDSVGRVCCDGAEHIRVFSLTLRSMHLDLPCLTAIIGVCRPQALALDRVECAEADCRHIYRYLSRLRIVSLRIAHSFIDFGTFKALVNKLSLKDFSFTGKEASISYRGRTAGPVSFFTSQKCTLVTEKELRCVESLRICEQDHGAVLTHPTPRLIRLRLESMAVDSALVQRIAAIKFIHFAGCTFKGLCFYELMRRLAGTLCYVGFTKTEIPLDGFAFMKRVLSGCQVVVSGITDFYIERKSVL